MSEFGLRLLLIRCGCSVSCGWFWIILVVTCSWWVFLEYVSFLFLLFKFLVLLRYRIVPRCLRSPYLLFIILVYSYRSYWACCEGGRIYVFIIFVQEIIYGETEEATGNKFIAGVGWDRLQAFRMLFSVELPQTSNRWLATILKGKQPASFLFSLCNISTRI
jgi:hypothetical protein